MLGRVTFHAAFALIAIAFSNALPQSPWQFTNRLQIGAERDDNIYESKSRPTAALCGRLLFRSRTERSWQRTQISFAYSGGLQTYSSHADENKLTNELNADLRWTLNRWCQITGAVQGTVKVYFNGPYDFGTTQSALQVTLQLPQRWALTLSTATSRLDYAESDAFDFLGRTVGATVRKRLADWLVAEGGLHVAWLQYLRLLRENAPPAYPFSMSEKQHDRQTGAVARLAIGRKFLIHLSAEFQRNTSNSFGYDYNRWRLSLIAAFRIAPRWLMRVAALRQHKKYAEPLSLAQPLELDTERSESNFLVGDVSYDISQDLGWLVRVAFYDNEGAVRGLFYQKTLLFSGFEYRF